MVLYLYEQEVLNFGQKYTSYKTVLLKAARITFKCRHWLEVLKAIYSAVFSSCFIPKNT